MTEFEVFKKAFIDAGYDIEITDYGDFGVDIGIKRLNLEFEFRNGKLDYILNERHDAF